MEKFAEQLGEAGANFKMTMDVKEDNTFTVDFNGETAVSYTHLGLETLSLRVERHVENTLKVVEYLNNHPQVEKVNHPSLPDSPYNEDVYKRQGIQ